MNSINATSKKAPSYDAVAITLHWMIFLCVIALFTSAQVAERLPRPERIALLDWHKLGGLIVLLLVMARLLWRTIRGAPELVPTSPVIDFVAKATHLALYLLLIAMPLAGLGMVLTAGRGITLLGVPPLLQKSEEIAKMFETAHGVIFIAIMGIVLLHAAAALWHHYFRHDATLGRMVPWLRGKA